MKKSSNWYIGTTHFLTAGFAFPWIANFIAIILIKALGIEGTLMQIVALAVWLGGLYVGIIYSAKYLAKTYESYDKNRVVKQGTMYHIIFPVFTLLMAVLFSTQPQYEVNPAGIAVSLTASAITAYLFYIWSHKMVQDKPAQA